MEAAAGYYSQMFSNNEVINIDISWGEVKGMPISAGDLADGVRPGIYRTYAQVLNGLKADAGHSSVQRQADASLPATDPLHANFYYVPYAEAKTLGQISPTGTEIDGYIGMSKTDRSYNNHRWPHPHHPRTVHLDDDGDRLRRPRLRRLWAPPRIPGAGIDRLIGRCPRIFERPPEGRPFL